MSRPYRPNRRSYDPPKGQPGGKSQPAANGPTVDLDPLNGGDRRLLRNGMRWAVTDEHRAKVMENLDRLSEAGNELLNAKEMETGAKILADYVKLSVAMEAQNQRDEQHEAEMSQADVATDVERAKAAAAMLDAIRGDERHAARDLAQRAANAGARVLDGSRVNDEQAAQ
jgi:hypothetical protein